MTENMAFLGEVKEYILERHPHIHHPIIKMVLAGEASLEQLRGFAREWWVIPKTHLINNAGKLAHAHLLRGGFVTQLLGSSYDRDIVDLLGESLMDEMGKTAISPVNHYEPYFAFAEALGLSREEVEDVDTLLPHSLLAMYTWSVSALNFSLLELLSSHNLVNDTANPVAWPPFADALRKHYGLSDEAVGWFDLHGEVDIEHGARSTEVLAKLIQTDEDRMTVMRCAKLGLGVKWTLFDGVMRGYVDQSYKR
ncbi:MAG: TenA family transcriptional regulator [Acidimicrobiales bacterium]